MGEGGAVSRGGGTVKTVPYCMAETAAEVREKERARCALVGVFCGGMGVGAEAGSRERG